MYETLSVRSGVRISGVRDSILGIKAGVAFARVKVELGSSPTAETKYFQEFVRTFLVYEILNSAVSSIVPGQLKHFWKLWFYQT